MDIKELLSTILLFAAIVTSLVGPPIIVVSLVIYIFRGYKTKAANRVSTPFLAEAPWIDFGANFDEHNITSYRIQDIPKSGLFTADERRIEYRRRGKSPSGVIDGIYNDMYRDGDRPYSDLDRDWDADA
jgi:hypothetical protein